MSERETIKNSLYQLVGSEIGVERLVDTFCEMLETTEVGRPIHILHLRGHGMAHARMEQFNFFSGMFGGPKLYAEKWGHSDVRKIHEHVPVSETDKDAWLSCMDMAMEKLNYNNDLRIRLLNHFTQMSSLIVKH